MDTSSFVLALVVLLVAIVATLGGVIALLKQKVVVDEAGHVTEIEIPLVGKFKSNYPSLAAVAIGTLLAFGVLHTLGIHPEKIPIIAKVLLKHPSQQLVSDVFVGVIPQQYHVVKSNVQTDQAKTIRILVDKANNYHVIVYTVTGINPISGQAQKVVADGVPDENNEFEATLRIQP
jgi:hypothetical protein